jgi:hypothetical protein
MIPALHCERCGSEEPTEVFGVGTFVNGEAPPQIRCSICKKCRQSLIRWLRRPQRSKEALGHPLGQQK